MAATTHLNKSTNMGYDGLTAIDLYCGSGAITEGLKNEGFRVLAAVDNDAGACKTYRTNHPDVWLLEENIREISAESLKEELRLHHQLDLLVVCAPCQPFSNHNKNRGSDDPRTDLIMQSLKFIKAFSPRAVLFENVPGIAVIGPLGSLKEELANVGYCLGDPINLDAADYGVPQRRQRCIMLAAADMATVRYFAKAITIRPRKSVRDAIGDLKPLTAGQRDPVDPLHFARNHKPIALERLRHIPKDGGSRIALPPELELACHKGRKNDFPDVYGRMKWDDVAPTLTTGCTDITKGRYAHPVDDRAISLREAALLQSFPRDYKFVGTPGQIAKQIGNAVPVAMARALAQPLKNILLVMQRTERTALGC